MAKNNEMLLIGGLAVGAVLLYSMTKAKAATNASGTTASNFNALNYLQSGGTQGMNLTGSPSPNGGYQSPGNSPATSP